MFASDINKLSPCIPRLDWNRVRTPPPLNGAAGLRNIAIASAGSMEGFRCSFPNYELISSSNDNRVRNWRVLVVFVNCGLVACAVYLLWPRVQAVLATEVCMGQSLNNTRQLLGMSRFPVIKLYNY